MRRRPDRPDERSGRRRVEVDAYARASVSSLWPLLSEARRWHEWSFLTASVLDRPGRPDPDGVGAIRRFTVHGFGSREEVVVFDPPHHLSYVILSGFPARRYRADVHLDPDPDSDQAGVVGPGTVIKWTATFDALVPGTGPLVEVVVRRLLTRFATSLARHAEQAPRQA